MPDIRLAKELLSRLYEGAMSPVAPEWEAPAHPSDENVLVSGGELGKNSPIVNKVWPGGAHIPGLREIYNEGVRPLTSILGLVSEGAARGGIKNGVKASIVRSPEGIILSDESAGLLQRLKQRLAGGEKLENIPLEERQKAMGMTDTVYHGTKNRDVPRGLIRGTEALRREDEYRILKTNHGIDADLGLHVDHDPVVANSAIAYGPKLKDGETDVSKMQYSAGDRLFPLKARIANPLELPDVGRWNDPHSILKNIDQHSGGPYKELYELANESIRKYQGSKGDKYGVLPSAIESSMYDWNDKFPKYLKSKGYDSIKYNNNVEGHGKPSYAVLDSNQVRMPWAKFDPRKILAGDLLAFKNGSGGQVGDELIRMMKIRAGKKVADMAKEKLLGSKEEEEQNAGE